MKHWQSLPQIMRIWRICCGVALILVGKMTLALDHPQGIALDCTHEGERQTFDLPLDDGVLHLSVHTSEASWLELEEKGQSVEVVGDHAGTTRVRVPPRFARSFIPLDQGQEVALRRFDPGRAQGTIVVTLHCVADSNLKSRLDWYRTGSALAGRLRAPVEEGFVQALLDDLALLVDSAPDTQSRALASHLVAQALLVNGRNADANAAFARAEDAWTAVNEKDRALAARVGRAEDANRTGQYDQVLELASPSAYGSGPESYFRVRLENSRCLALWYLDRLGDAGMCYERTLTRFSALDEQTEYVSTLQTYADLLAAMGNPARAEALGHQALDLVRGPNAALVRGGIEELLGKLALRRGAVTEGLSRFDSALSDFDAAHSPARRQANVELRIADLYGQLGAYDDALAELANAVQRFNARDAPARIAEAMLMFSRLESDTDRLESARLWALAAESSYARLHLTAEEDAARLQRLEVMLRQGQLDEVQREIRQAGSPRPLEVSQVELIRTEVSLRSGDLLDARTRIDQLQRSSLALQERIRLAQLDALYWNKRADPQRALRILSEAAIRMLGLAQKTHNPVLAYVIARQVLPLRRSAMKIILQHAFTSDGQVASLSEADINTLWTWLQLHDVDSAKGSDSDATKQQESFDGAVAAELLTPSRTVKVGAELSAQRSLLSVFANPASDSAKTAESGTSVAALADLQKHLAPNAALAAYVDGDTVGALLWVTHDSAMLLRSAPPADVRAAAALLRELTRSPTTPVREIESAARHLSDQLLRDVPGPVRPRHLYALAQEPLDGVVWSLLPWNNSPEPLIDQTTVNLVRLVSAGRAEPAVAAPSMHIIVASQADGTITALPVLASATVEARQIKDSVSDRPLTVSDGESATRQATLAAMSDSGSWVHIAAHGFSRPRRIGYAGVWLGASGPHSAPAFLSWLDVVNAGVSAELVVLNACDLGDSGEAVNGSMSFAAAVSRAGAGQVVAALWAVSDSASALWVPEFYSTISADPDHDAAEALRSAQLRLRSTSAFRHPYFWAGMQSISQLHVGALPKSPSVQGRHNKAGAP